MRGKREEREGEERGREGRGGRKKRLGCSSVGRVFAQHTQSLGFNTNIKEKKDMTDILL